MGQKVNPIGLRLGINRTWDSRWYAEGANTPTMLHEDIQIRNYLHKRLGQAGVAKIVIERPAKKARITIHTARPGVVIGKKGADIEKLRERPRQDDQGRSAPEHRRDPQARDRRHADRREHRPAARAPRRLPPRHEARRAVGHAPGRRAASASTARGRLGGAEIARMEWYREGRVPLHTLRADVDYGVATAKTTYGTCGVKVWVFKGEIMAHDPMAQDKRAEEAAPQRRRRASSAPSRGTRKKSCCSRNAPNTARPSRAASAAPPRAGSTSTSARIGLKAMEPERVTARQIEAARRAITRHMKRAGRVWIRVFPDVPVSKKPAEVRMGTGKGAPEFWVARVKPGRIMFELDGVTPPIGQAKRLALGAAKLPIKTRFVQRVGVEG